MEKPRVFVNSKFRNPFCITKFVLDAMVSTKILPRFPQQDSSGLPTAKSRLDCRCASPPEFRN